MQRSATMKSPQTLDKTMKGSCITFAVLNNGRIGLGTVAELHRNPHPEQPRPTRFDSGSRPALTLLFSSDELFVEHN
jgi:hypothetical protein